MPVVNDIIALMEYIAPCHLAEEWDNSGLQCGSRDWPVKNIIISLDPTLFVVEAACDKKADLLITHHPLIFNPLKNVIIDTPVGKILDLCIRHKLAIFSAHTNLDSVKGGLNDVFAEKIGLTDLRLLAPNEDPDACKLVVYVPVDAQQKVLNAIFETGAGIINNYTCCTFRQPGKGTFKPGRFSIPYIGERNKIAEIEEVRIEIRIQKTDLQHVISHVRKVHPYETMAYDVYSLHAETRQDGFGRIGIFKNPINLEELSRKIKEKLKLNTIKVAGPLSLEVKKAAVCTGSGSGLMKDYFASDADVYISGDLKYHDARDSEIQSRGLIDVGHFASEELMIDMLKDRLMTLIKEKGFDTKVEAFQKEADPFNYI